MEFHYRIEKCTEDGWIFISGGAESDYGEANAFAYLLKKIERETGGTIEELGEQQYRIKGDALKLIYQWDGLFGITVIRPDAVEEAEAVAYLEKFF
ncbi:MAG: hypothetical protein IJ600_10270 [Lachnospiraceae bacterium]|nr:hypothetical protein [Lachnospiraceae bacterium]